jgi:hypothetical protein
MSFTILNQAPACPRATQDIALNLQNRQNAIRVAMYGPANPNQPSRDYWNRLAGVWGISPDEAKTMRCGNCAAFDVSATMRSCISQGLGGGRDVEQTIDAGVLGYCHAFKFKCAAKRTCSAWIVGGPKR